MSFIGWIVFGVIAGFVASKLVNQRGEGFVTDLALGIVGAVVGGFLFSRLGYGDISGFNLYSMFVAVVGAVIVLLVYHMITGRRGIN